MDKILEDLRDKKPFVYEVDNKLYAIEGDFVFDCTYSKVVAPDFKRLFNVYEANIESSCEELRKNETAKVMFELIIFSKAEIEEENNKQYIIPIKEFWNGLTEEQKEKIQKQIDDFVSMLTRTDFKNLYPGLK